MSISDPKGLAPLLEALDELVDYGTVTVRGNGQITMPKATRTALRMNEEGHWRVFGVPGLGVAIVVGEPDVPKDALASLIRKNRT